MNGRILSAQEIQEIQELIAAYQNSLKTAVEKITVGINVFNKNEIVQSFYTSGELGVKIEEELAKINSVMEEYNAAITAPGGLVDTTLKVMDAQINNLNNGIGGY